MTYRDLRGKEPARWLLGYSLVGRNTIARGDTSSPAKGVLCEQGFRNVKTYFLLGHHVLARSVLGLPVNLASIRPANSNRVWNNKRVRARVFVEIDGKEVLIFKEGTIYA
jgi:hypothetical protein